MALSLILRSRLMPSNPSVAVVRLRSRMPSTAVAAVELASTKILPPAAVALEGKKLITESLPMVNKSAPLSWNEKSLVVAKLKSKPRLLLISSTVSAAATELL